MNRFPLLSLRLLISTVAALSLFPLHGCGGSSPLASPSGTGNTTQFTAGGAASVYVTQNGSGSISPSATLTLPAGFSVTCVTVDSAGQIYIGGYLSSPLATGEILVYPAGSTGSAKPVRTIVGGASTFNGPNRLVVDSTGLLYVASGTPATGFDVYAATATGAATPLRMVSGLATQIEPNPISIAVDKSGTVYICNFGAVSGTGSILAFSSTANGNVAPTRVISGSVTQMGTVFSVDTDSSGNIYVVSQPGGAPITASILEFAATATGNVAPMRVIAGSNTGLSSTRGLRVDAVGNIYVVAISGPISSATPYLEAFASRASGNVAPSVTFTSSAWTPTTQYELAVK